MNDAPVKPGDLLAGKYRVEKVLGSGAMGVVVAATHVQLDRRVAVKLMKRGGGSREEEDRFAREARAAGRLQSQHVAKVLDFGALESGEPYIVMEYLDGQDVAATLQQHGVMEVGEAVTFILQACDALAEAHALGIVHRDIKPANLFLTRSIDGSPCLKLVDFGVAKMRDGGLSLTGSAASLGSPLYMAPEVMNGKAKLVDGRADIWSLGVTFYQMLAGTTPFARETIEQLLKAVFFDPPPPIAQYRPGVPAGLGAVIEQALEKQLDRRFANVASLAAALAPYAPPNALPYVERIAKVQRVDVAPARPTDLLPPEPKASPWGASGWKEEAATVAPSLTAAEAPAGKARLLAIAALVLGAVAAGSAGLYVAFGSRGAITVTPPAPTLSAPVPTSPPLQLSAEIPSPSVTPAPPSVTVATPVAPATPPRPIAGPTRLPATPGDAPSNPWKAPRR